jgi:hypothetical protein
MGLKLVVKMLLAIHPNHWLSVVEIWSLSFCLVQMSSKPELVINLPNNSNSLKTKMCTELTCQTMRLLCVRKRVFRLKRESEVVKGLACVRQGLNLTLAAFLLNLNNNKLINFDFNFIFNLINYKSFN